MSAVSQELANLRAARAQLADQVAAMRSGFASIEQALRGAAQQRTQAVGRPSGRALISNLDALVADVPTPSTDLGSDGLLAQYGRTGFRERSFDTVVPVTAPNPINDTGNEYDAAGVYDAWILNPSIDAKIDFDKPPSQNTPFIAASTFMNFQVKKQKVYYLAQNPGTVGVMQIWLLRFKVG